MSPPPAARPSSPLDLFVTFTLLALQGFGGVLAVTQRELCDRKRWLTHREFVAMLSFGQVLPGPNVTNLALLTLGYDANLTPKIFLNGNVGFGWAPTSLGAPTITGSVPAGQTNGGDFLGTEFNLESGYKVSDNLTLKATAAYMLLGAFYKDTGVKTSGTAGTASFADDPENPYSMRLHAQFKF